MKTMKTEFISTLAEQPNSNEHRKVFLRVPLDYFSITIREKNCGKIRKLAFSELLVLSLLVQQKDIPFTYSWIAHTLNLSKTTVKRIVDLLTAERLISIAPISNKE
jgi:DNA-binding MarR family transcriptional regulator